MVLLVYNRRASVFCFLILNLKFICIFYESKQYIKPVLCFHSGQLKNNFFQAARETGALKEAKDKLEKKVEELTWRIQLEKRLRVIFMTF